MRGLRNAVHSDARIGTAAPARDALRMRYRSAALVLVTAAVGCGGGGASEHQTTTASTPKRPDDVTCRDLKTKAAAHALARKLVDRVVAPPDHTDHQTIGTIGESLYATCRQPHLPGVKDAGDYKPVEPVLAAIQRDFDEEEIAGG